MSSQAPAAQDFLSISGRPVLLCNCGNSMPLDGNALVDLAAAAGMVDTAAEPRINYSLCRGELSALAARWPVNQPAPLVACGQERVALQRQWVDAGRSDTLGFTDIRDTAGWSAEAAAAMPKMLALLAAACVEPSAPPTIDLVPGDRLLILGSGQAAVDAARRLADTFTVTLLLPRNCAVLLPARRDFRLVRGSVGRGYGAINRFDIEVIEGSDAAPWTGDAAVHFGGVANLGGDLVLDLRGGMPLFPAARLGCVRADPDRPDKVAEALLELADLSGPILVPRSIAQDAARCVHSAGGRVNCTQCLDACPTGALSSVGQAIALDPLVCGGCGACSAVCPTSSLGYSAPPLVETLRRLSVLLGGYRLAGGDRATLLLHGGGRQDDVLATLAASGPGLPANVLPLAIDHPTQLAAEALLALLCLGAGRVIIWRDPAEDAGEEHGLATALNQVDAMLAAMALGPGRIVVTTTRDPFALLAVVVADPGLPALPVAERFDVTASPRARLQACLDHLSAMAGTERRALPLPRGAPCGGLEISEACSLCLACSRACPTGALEGDPRAQVLSFLETTCVQCGLCASICPEDAIRLIPRIGDRDAGLRVVAMRDETAHCLACSRPFGGRRSIEAVIGRLGRSATALSQSQIARLRYCDSCRLQL